VAEAGPEPVGPVAESVQAAESAQAAESVQAVPAAPLRGSRDFAARDPEGNRWSFGTYRGEPRKTRPSATSAPGVVCVARVACVADAPGLAAPGAPRRPRLAGPPPATTASGPAGPPRNSRTTWDFVKLSAT
jgi:hypothetical protein